VWYSSSDISWYDQNTGGGGSKRGDETVTAELEWWTFGSDSHQQADGKKKDVNSVPPQFESKNDEYRRQQNSMSHAKKKRNEPTKASPRADQQH